MTRRSENPYEKHKTTAVPGHEGAVTKFTFGTINAVFFGFLIMLCFNAYMWDRQGYQTLMHALNHEYQLQTQNIFNRDKSASLEYNELSNIDAREIDAEKNNINKIIKNNPLNFSTYFTNHKLNISIENKVHLVEKFISKIETISVNTIKIIFAKLTAVFASILVFMAFIILGTSDGLLSRYIRTSEGGRESTLMFHKVSDKLIQASSIIIFLYLICPIFISPEWVVVLLSFLLLMYCRSATSNLKKYL